MGWSVHKNWPPQWDLVTILVKARSSLALFVGVLFLTSCSSAESPTETAPLDVQKIAADASEYQAQLLEDGVVSPEEYEQATLAHRQCVAESGAKPGEIYTILDNQLTFDWEVEAPDTAAVEKISAVADACFTEFKDAVGAVWAEQNLLSPAEREALKPQVIECLNADGFEIADDASYDEIVGAVSGRTSDKVGSACVEQFGSYFSVSSSNG